MHAAPVLRALQPVPRQTCCNSFCFGRRCGGRTWPGQGPRQEGRGVQEWAQRGATKGSQAQTGMILAATVGPLLAGVALSYFLSGSSK